MSAPKHAHERSELKRALTLLIRLTWVLNGVAREMLGHGEAGNRSVQMVLLLHGSPDLSPSAAAEALGVSRSTVSHLVNRLESDGLVDRRVDPTDHRAAKIRLRPGPWARWRLSRSASPQCWPTGRRCWASWPPCSGCSPVRSCRNR